MFLYLLIDQETDSNEDYIVRDIYLLQHENNYTDGEFNDLCKQYSKYSNWYVAEMLQNEHGFRLVPNFRLK
jgi:hypothetical protein